MSQPWIDDHVRRSGGGSRGSCGGFHQRCRRTSPGQTPASTRATMASATTGLPGPRRRPIVGGAPGQGARWRYRWCATPPETVAIGFHGSGRAAPRRSTCRLPSTPGVGSSVRSPPWRWAISSWSLAAPDSCRLEAVADLDLMAWMPIIAAASRASSGDRAGRGCRAGNGRPPRRLHPRCRRRGGESRSWRDGRRVEGSTWGRRRSGAGRPSSGTAQPCSTRRSRPRG